MIDTNVIYYGIFLDDVYKEKLLNTIENMPSFANVLTSDDVRIYLDHCTCLFHSEFATKEDMVDTLASLEGKKIAFKATSIGKSDRAMAFGVNIPSDICANKHPHITICTMNGGKPFESNNIENWYALGEEIPIRGTIKAFRKK